MKIPTRQEAINLFFKATDIEDPFWIDLVEDFYDEKTDSWPTIFHIGKALGFTNEEMEKACGWEIGRIEKLELLK